MNKRRLAGTKLILEPVGNISKDIKQALDNLRQVQGPEMPPGSNLIAENAPFIDTTFSVDGHRVGLHARPTQITWRADGDISDNVIGNQQEIKDLMKDPPNLEYTLSWDVDGSYGGDRGGNDNLDRKTSLKIAREVQRRWDQDIKKLPDNSIVTNAPVGASSGDFGRADIYMSNGFGPVQKDGMQYGIIRSGRIKPLSPFAPSESHVEHLAKKMRMAGDVDLEQALLQAGRGNPDTNNRATGLGNIKDYGYAGGDDDYLDYDDYTPPINRREAKDLLQSASGYRPRPGEASIPEIAAREEMEREASYRGLDPSDFRNRPGVTGQYQEDLSGTDVQAIRDMQVALMQQPAVGRGFADEVQRIIPRPLPQPITAGDLVNRERSWRNTFREDAAELGQGERGDAVRREIRARIDDAVRGSEDLRQALGSRDVVKELMVDRQTRPDGVVVQQEMYTPEDVSQLRALQEAAAIHGVMGDREIFPRRRMGASWDDEREPGRGKYGDIDPLADGTVTLDRRALSSGQQRAARQVRREETNPRARQEEELMSLLSDRFAPDFEGRPRLMHNLYGATTLNDLTAGFEPNFQAMSPEQSMRIVRQSVEQPGTTEPAELAQAYVNMRANSANPQANTQLADAEQALARAARGAAEPIRRSAFQEGLMAPNQPADGVGRERQRRLEERESSTRRRRRRRPLQEQLAETEAYTPSEFADAPDGMNFNEFREWNTARAEAPLPQGQRFDELEDVQLSGGVRRGPQINEAALVRGSNPNWGTGMPPLIPRPGSEQRRSQWSDAPLVDLIL